MSYLRGPLTRAQIKNLMKPAKESAPPQQSATSAATPAATPAVASYAKGAAQTQRPALPPEVSQYFIPIRSSGETGARLVYQPMVIGAAQVRFADKKVDSMKDLTVLTQIANTPIPIEWDAAVPVDIAVADLETTPQEGAGYAGCRRPPARLGLC